VPNRRVSIAQRPGRSSGSSSRPSSHSAPSPCAVASRNATVWDVLRASRPGLLAAARGCDPTRDRGASTATFKAVADPREPDWAQVIGAAATAPHLRLLWGEYDTLPRGYGYSYLSHYRAGGGDVVWGLPRSE